MADFPTYRDLFNLARDAMLYHSSKVTREVVEREGTDANILAGGAASVGDEVVGQLARVCAALTLGAAGGKALDRLVFDRFGLLRKPAAPALGSVRFATVAPAAGSFSIPQGAKLSTPDGVQFLTTATATFPAGSTGPVTVAVRSASAGSNQAAQVGTINSVVSTIVGAPADLSVSNPLATAGSADEEPDDAYRERARLFFSTVRRGTVAAIEEQALRYPGVVNAAGFEDLDAWGRPAKRAQLVVADQYTDKLATLSAVPATYAAQSQVLAQEVFNSLHDTRPCGIYVEVYVAKMILQPVVLALSFKAGVDADSVAYAARVAVVNAVNKLDPGAALAPDAVVGALRGVRGLIVSGDEVLSPSGEVVPAKLEVLRTALGLVRASTVQPDVALAGTSNPDAV